MVDLAEKNRGNISLPPRLQSPDVFDPDFVEDEHAVPIINMQKAFYEIRISDTEKRIKRLENRIDELLETSEDTKTLTENVDIGTGDHIAYLNKQISTETGKIQETKQRIDAIAKFREEANEAHMRNVDAANQKYEKTRVALTSEIKALNAKINTLEDYKETRTDLQEKFRMLEETMRIREEIAMQRRDAINRKFKIDREKLKNEMYSRLLALAGTFQIQISNAITIPVHRLLRENIVIKIELMEIVKETLRRKEVYTTARSKEKDRYNSMKTGKRDTMKHVITVKIQGCLIKALKEEHSAMKKRLANLKMPEEFAQENYDALVESVRDESMAFVTRMRKLEVSLHREKVKLDRAKNLKNQAVARKIKNEEILYDVKYAVACALKINQTGEDILNMSELELISHLLNLIVRGESQIKSLVVLSTESIPRPDEVYITGDLGFEPQHIDLERSRLKKKLDDKRSETESIDIPTVSSVLPSAISLKHENEFEQIVRQMRGSTLESSESQCTSSKDTESGQSNNANEDISDVAESLDAEKIDIEDEESFKSDSEENEDT